MTPAKKYEVKASKPHIQHKRGKIRKMKRDVKVIHFDTRRNRIPFHIIFTVMLIFTGGVGTAYSFAYLQDMRLQIDSKRLALQQQQDENAATQAEITPHLSTEEIERIAREHLNMGPADASQIIRIYVPRQSYVVQSYADTDAGAEGMWQSAWWHIRNWLGV